MAKYSSILYGGQLFTAGLQGPPGPMGGVWLFGSGAPGSGLGRVEDLYLDIDNSDVYQKVDELTWVLQTNIKGDPGTPGGTAPLSNLTPEAITPSAGGPGTTDEAARIDHVHPAVYASSVADGLMASGDKVKLDAIGIPRVEDLTLIAADVVNKQIGLANVPKDSSRVRVVLIGGSAQVFSIDYTVTGSVVDWDGYGLELILQAGDRLQIAYDS